MGAKSMAITPYDERNLIYPLLAQLQSEASWDQFLKRLLPRTGATRLCLLQKTAGSAPVLASRREASQAMGTSLRSLDIDALEQCGLIPLQSLREGRVYSLDEMHNAASDKNALRQKQVMARENVRHARFVRFTAGTEINAWLIIMHDRKDFGAADSALLTSVVPFLSVAISLLEEIRKLQVRATVAEEALSMIGVGQAVLDAEGKTLVADETASAAFKDFGLRPDGLASSSKAMARQPGSARQLLAIGQGNRSDVMLRPARNTCKVGGRRPAAVALIRRTGAQPGVEAGQLLADRFGLSAREAELALALCRGQSLIDAGDALHLTRETARNYSKRVYAKTGTSGQADLVRTILGDLVPFA
jgi:DNA-binding CsgD family transcriptional regulator